MLLRRPIFMPPSQVCVDHPDDTPFAFEADNQGQMTGVRRDLAPVVVIDRSGAGEAQPSLPEKHSAAVRFVAPFLRVNAFITFRAETLFEQGEGVGLDLL